MSDAEQAEIAHTSWLSRRALLARAGAIGLGAAALPLAACATSVAALRNQRPATPDLTSPSPTPIASPDPTPSPSATPGGPVTIAITGDIMLGRSVNEKLIASGDRFPFNYTADYLRGFDLTVGNLECVVSALGQPIPGKQYTFRADPRAFPRLGAAGFDIVSVANNHSGDYGQEAFADMVGHLPGRGLRVLGGGLNRADAHRPVVATARGTTIGFLAYCAIEPFGFAATATAPGHAWLDPQLMAADISSLRGQVDYLIVFNHWGVEYQPASSARQVATARAAVDAGADFVVGAHPHVIQPAETYRGKPIVYSLGNFVFDQMWSDDVRRGNVLGLAVQGSQLLEWRLRQSYITGDFGEPRWA